MPTTNCVVYLIYVMESINFLVNVKCCNYTFLTRCDALKTRRAVTTSVLSFLVNIFGWVRVALSEVSFNSCQFSFDRVELCHLEREFGGGIVELVDESLDRVVHQGQSVLPLLLDGAALFRLHLADCGKQDAMHGRHPIKERFDALALTCADCVNHRPEARALLLLPAVQQSRVFGEDAVRLQH